MGRQLMTNELADRALSAPRHNGAVVIEHGDPISSQPHITLEAGCPEPQSKRKRGDRVLLRMSSGAAVRERDRFGQQ